MDARHRIVFIVSIATPLLIGMLGGIITSPAIPTGCENLEKPSFSPPSWIFAPVWTSLYLLMGVASFLVWREISNRPGVKTALLVYGFQLMLNLIWSVLFFGLKNPGLGLIEIIILLTVIAIMIRLFWNVSKPAAMLLLPYLIWVTFASVLNLAIWQLNSA